MTSEIDNAVNLDLFKKLISGLPLTQIAQLQKLLRSEWNRQKTILKRQTHLPFKLKLQHLIDADWCEIYFSKSESRNHYVYLHVDPTENNASFAFVLNNKEILFNMPFYVGQGVDNRYKSFLRNPIHRSRLNGLTRQGYGIDDISKIIVENLTESEARCLEAKLILYFGLKISSCDVPALSGYDACLLNKEYEKYPDHYNNYHGSHAIFCMQSCRIKETKRKPKGKE